jgi:hypothetical protein
MGRPIKKKFFGNLYDNQAVNGFSGIGGEGIVSVALTASTLAAMNTGTFTIPAGSITAPATAGGTKPTLSLVVTGATTATVRVVTAGSGYTAVPTITGTGFGALAGGSGGATATATLSTANAKNDSLSFTSYLTTGSSAVSGGDIIKQESSRRYLVRNSQGVGQVRLSFGYGVSHTLQPGYMHLIATDAGGATYYVTKLTARKATLVSRTNTSTSLVTLTTDTANSAWPVGQAKWTTNAAFTSTNGPVVTIANITV